MIMHERKKIYSKLFDIFLASFFVDNFMHIYTYDLYDFFPFINKIITGYPLDPVDNRTLVPKEYFC